MAPAGLSLAAADDDKRVAEMLDKALRDGPDHLPEAGERAALRRWAAFQDKALDDYATARDLPAKAGTSGLSPYLKVGAVHPRTLLADLAGRRSRNAMTFTDELGWREFYADVLWHRPGSAWHDLREELAGMAYDDPGDAFDASREGRTGYPIVDAGMRQLLATGWMHNRVRRSPPASSRRTCTPGGRSAPGTSWTTCSTATSRRTTTAGSGRPAPVPTRRRTSAFNPVTQGKNFDLTGDYVRRWVPGSWLTSRARRHTSRGSTGPATTMATRVGSWTMPRSGGWAGPLPGGPGVRVVWAGGLGLTVRARVHHDAAEPALPTMSTSWGARVHRGSAPRSVGRPRQRSQRVVAEPVGRPLVARRGAEAL